MVDFKLKTRTALVRVGWLLAVRWAASLINWVEMIYIICLHHKKACLLSFCADIIGIYL